MRRVSVVVVLLAIIAVSHCQEETVRYAEVEKPAVVVLLSGMSEIDDKAFDTPLANIAVSNDDSFNPVHILGRRFGPFDGPSQDNFDFATQLLSFLTSRLLALDTFQSRINAAMAIRCPRLRQRALENILLEQHHTVLPQHSSVQPIGATEPGFIGSASNNNDDTFSISSASSKPSSSSSHKGRWYPGIADEITVEEPEFWHRFDNINNNHEKDIFYLDFDSDDDPPMDMPLPMPMPYPPHHHSHEHDNDDDDDHHDRHHHNEDHDEDEHHRDHHKDDDEDHEHDHEHHDHFHHDDHHEDHHERPLGFKTKPLTFNPLNHLSTASSSSSFSAYENTPEHHNHRGPDFIFSATISTDFFDDDGFNSIPSRFRGGRNRREEEHDDEDEDEDEEFVNWNLFNDDGSLNTGLILFVVLCCACAVVWSALLMQCARMSYSWVSGSSSDRNKGRNQFIFLDSESESDDDEVVEKEGGKWKTGKKVDSVVIAAEYTSVDSISKAEK